MTGFGHSEGDIGTGSMKVTAIVEVRSVNHRFFTASIRLPGSLSRSEAGIRELLRKSVTRGHVTLVVRLEKEPGGSASIDHERFAEAVNELRMLGTKHGIPGDVDIGTVLRMPNVITGGGEAERPELPMEELMPLVSRAVDELTRAREAEGARLEAILSERLSVVNDLLVRVRERAPERLLVHRDRLREAVRELTDGVTVDEARLAQEIALLADRLDITEETDRFASHVEAFRETLSGRDSVDGAGKRLGFLLQEMLREANTMGSKAADTDILHQVVSIKEELERIREQVENLE